MFDAAQAQAAFAAKFQTEQDAITRLEAVGAAALGAGAVENLRLLRRIAGDGVARVLARRSSPGQAAAEQLLQESSWYGVKAALLPGPQRGGASSTTNSGASGPNGSPSRCRSTG
ncbi:MAG: hypothetical protein ACRC33_14480 [Gemmataceae bacterium]